jgi:signal transduction histidine kinase
MPNLNEGERLRYSTIIRHNSEHLLAVINDVLDLSRAKKASYSRIIECSPISILVDVVSLMRVRAPERRASALPRAGRPCPNGSVRFDAAASDRTQHGRQYDQVHAPGA